MIVQSETLTLEITKEYPENYHSILGGDDNNPTWEEYINEYKPEYHPHLELIKEGIAKMGWMGETAERIANYWCFKFSDGVCFGFSWRAWGDLMQAIIGKREGYMTYYM